MKLFAAIRIVHSKGMQSEIRLEEFDLARDRAIVAVNFLIIDLALHSLG